MRYRNIDIHTRVWLNITVDGHTLRLEPDEIADLERNIDDPWLRPVEKPKPKQTPESPAKAEE